MAGHRVRLRAPLKGRPISPHGTGPPLEVYPMGRYAVVRTSSAAPPSNGGLPAALGSNGNALVPTPAHVVRLVRAVARAGAALVPPIRVEDAEAHLEVVTPSPAATDRLLKAVRGARLESRRSLPATPPRGKRAATGLLLDRLTRRQAVSLTAAIDLGYYDSPRRVTTADVARHLGVARSTFEEHLRTAESRVIGAMAPLVRLRTTADGAAPITPDALKTYAAFSRDLGLYVELTLHDERVARLRLTKQRPSGALDDPHPYLARILSHLATGRDALDDIPLDLTVSSFDRKVLEALRSIRPGSVLTYGQLAARLGRPRAARAVGNAVARNPVPVIVPCHRVVPAAGGLGNYSGGDGPETKRRLLETEGAWPRRGRRS